MTSVEKLKTALTTAPVSGFPQESKGKFKVGADASKDSLGGILSQEQEGQERVISYYSVSAKPRGVFVHSQRACICYEFYKTLSPLSTYMGES